MSRTTRAGTRRAPARRRAVGTRDRIVSHLALVSEIADHAGMASARLAEAVGYPGSSVAFAQLLSGMERDGLITREVRGKRTYRIALAGPAPVLAAIPASAGVQVLLAGAAADPAAAEQGAAAAPPAGVGFPAVIDYDELARRVLVHLVRRLRELNPTELATLEDLLAPGNELKVG